MSFRAASYAGISVVACKTDKGIIRAIQYPSYATYPRGQVAIGRKLVGAIIAQVGALNLADTEWTGCFYSTEPYYLYDLPGATIKREIPSGVWLFPWIRPPDPDRKYGPDLGYSDEKHATYLGEIPR